MNALCINGRVAANRQMNKGKVQEFDEFKLEIISKSVETFHEKLLHNTNPLSTIDQIRRVSIRMDTTDRMCLVG